MTERPSRALAMTEAKTTPNAAATARRMPWPRFLLRAGLALLLVLAVGAYVTDRFRIGLDDQSRQCLPPHRWFLIDRYDRDLAQGALVAFAARGLDPYFRDGQTVVKRVAGVPGDRITVDSEAVRINGALVAEGLALAGTLGRASSDFQRADILPSGHLWVMGETADSFDSRYWGPLPQAQVIGRAYALW